ncbi:hypothetical protein [Amycolatopsis sp. NPDC052450]|uniref:hypothetical protein n=1 Tax=Amycolatopsis sp. NPDC052450 TaxID=3363937 RepID=UPI0037C58686
MTGPEHYREAERLMAKAEDGNRSFEYHQQLMNLAQVHATLALAAATAMAGRLNTNYRNDSRTAGMHVSDSQAWDVVAGEPS